MEIDKESLSSIINRVDEGLCIINRNKKIIMWNKAAEKLTGYKHDEVVDSKCSDSLVVHLDERGNDICTNSCPLTEVIKDKKTKSATVYLHHKNGHQIPVKVKYRPIINDEGIVTGIVENFSVINDNREESLNSKMCQISLYDKDYISAELKQIFKNKSVIKNCGVIRFDVDNLSYINIQYGEKVGTKILKIISENIFTNSSSTDIYGRWYDDELLGIIHNVDQKTLYKHAEKIRVAVENSFLNVKGEKVSVTLSVGGTIMRKSDYMLTMMERISKLLYNSRESGGNCTNIQ